MNRSDNPADRDLGALPAGTRVRISSSMVGVIIANRGAVVEVQLEEPERVSSSWFSPACTAEVLEPRSAA